MSQSTATPAPQILRLRETPHKKCSVGGEPLLKGQYVVRTGEGEMAHRDCAGLEHKLQSCTECFMIQENCICGL